MAQTRDQICGNPGRVYFDEKVDKYYFRTNDLTEFVFVTKMFKYYGPSEVHAMLRDFKAEATRINTESGRQVRVYAITREAVAGIGHVRGEAFKAEFKREEDF
jgi:hypothetical protein